MDKNWHKLEQLLRQGERAPMLRILQEAVRGKLHREDRIQAARLYRKAGLAGRSLRILGPWEQQQSELERAEYGAALMNLGAQQEAMRVLDALKHSQDPRVGWIRAAKYIREWDWQGAIPILEHLPRSEMYLATCLIHGAREYERAETLLEGLLRQFAGRRAADPMLMQATTLLLLAQGRALAGRIAPSEQALALARQALPPSSSAQGTLLSWMIREWELLLRLQRTGGRDRLALRELLGEVRAGFRALQGWEWARGCPLFVAEIQDDAQALRELCWTTPYPAFHARVLPRLGGAAGLGTHFRLRLGSAPRARSPGCLDVAIGEWVFARGQAARLKPLQSRHRLLMALATDFHRPLRVAELHEQLFPGEGFRPEISSDRVHKILQRLRLWFAERKIPLELQAVPGGFSLASTSGCELLLSRPQASLPLPGPELLQWMRTVRASFGGEPFSSGQVLKVLGGARRTTVRRLNQAVESGLLRQSGSGPLTRYHAD